jgi:hypothetical protein
MSDNLMRLANEEAFPGNMAALAQLQSSLASGGLVGFTGAGTSAPLAPTWTGLLRELADAGEKEGFLSEADQTMLLQQIVDDPLEVASSLEEAYTTQRFRATVSQRFILNGQCTEVHDLIVKLPISSVVTLNYDDGLSTASVRHTQAMPRIIRPDDKYDIHRWIVGQDEHPPQTIIHWHGVAAAPDRMVLTADDYNKFYSVRENESFIEELWRARNLLVIGFGFRDPFLTRIAEGVLRNAATDNLHSALIGRLDGEPMTPLIRRQFSKKFRLNPVFYRIQKDAEGREDHSEIREILAALANSQYSLAVAPQSGKSQILPTQDTPLAAAERELKDGLFVGPNGQTLYVEPRLMAGTKLRTSGDSAEIYVDVSHVAASGENYIISSSMEAGSTTLGRRLAVEYIRLGVEPFIRDVTSLPKYKKALSEDKAFRDFEDTKKRALILDKFDPVRHERTLKEISGLKQFSSIILLTRSQSDELMTIKDIDQSIAYQELKLCFLQRPDIRSLANTLFDTFDSDAVSAAVEKTYSDLLELCIPLTPLNVIMYLSVVHREGSFTPLNRLQIMERFIRDLLHKPSDVYRDSFNAENKIDVISAFVFQLYVGGRTSFTLDSWNAFCADDMRSSMTWFDKDSLFNDLVENRIVVEFAGCYLFKYKLYYSYFVGKYVAQRPAELAKFLEEGNHLNLDSLVEIIAGISKDNVSLVTDLVIRLENAITEFERQYQTADLDPYDHAEWRETKDEVEKLWEPVVEKLSAGPASDSEVDKLKRSIVAESRTADQNVVIREFSDYQRSVSFNQFMLAGAVRESQRLPGDLKLRAMNAIYRSFRIYLQIGFLFAPVIATRRFFVWNSIAFYNAMNWEGYFEATDEQKAGMVAGALPRAIASRAADELGSRRLGTVYENLVDSEELSGFGHLMTFTLLLRSKPEGWEGSARNLLDKVDRTAMYLRYMLGASLRQFNQEVNTNAERSAIKRTVAVIQAKRDVKKALPNSKAVGKALRKLELRKYFERNARAEIDDGVNVGEVEQEVNAAIEGEVVAIGDGEVDQPLEP